MPRPRNSSPVRSDVILEQIRADILNGRLAPRSKLGFARLGEQYSASASVLREVLTRLVEQGLAESEAQFGFRVVDVSTERVLELTDARVVIESQVVREAIAKGGIAWEAEVVATHHALARTTHFASSGEITPEWLEAHEAFHVAILSGCANSYLIGSAVRLRTISEVHRCWSIPEHNRTHRDVAKEHHEIMVATLARDADLAAKLTEDHIRLTTQLLMSGGVMTAGRAAEPA